MNGNVFVDLKEEVECDAVIVQCKGKEKCYWQETRHRWALLFGERERDKLPGGRGTNCQAGEGHAASTGYIYTHTYTFCLRFYQLYLLRLSKCDINEERLYNPTILPLS